MLQQALAIHAEVGSPRHEAITHLHLAYHHAALGEAAQATAALEQALAVGEGRLDDESHAWILALLGRFEEARALGIEDRATTDAIDILAATHLDLSNVEGVEVMAVVENVLARAASSRRTSARVRYACALFEKALAPRPAAGVTVTTDGRAFLGPDGIRVDLARRRHLRLALLMLVERRERAPGVGVSWEALLAAAWPGERPKADAGFARVRNALATLRKLGLRDVLQTRDDGYLLDPSVPVRRGEI
jgi:hypothetical protein